VYEAECPWSAISVVLFSAALIETTNPTSLAKFTGYDLGFVCAVAWNMRNNRLWTATEYVSKKWKIGEPLSGDAFWEEVSIGAGTLFFEGAEVYQSIQVDEMNFEPKLKISPIELRFSPFETVH